VPKTLKFLSTTPVDDESDILVSTAFIAVALGAISFVAEPENAILQGIGLFAFGLAALPAAATLRMHDAWVGIFVFSLPGLAALLIMSVFWLGADSMPIEIPIAAVLFLGGFYGGVSCVLIAAKTLGYRLVWGRRAKVNDVDLAGRSIAAVDTEGKVESAGTR